MTVDDVKAIVEKIRKWAADDEAAHSMEDSLREDVLTAIAEGKCSDPQACAAEALKTSEINFARWCA